MIHIELQPELEARVAAQAHARGLALEQYIVERLEASAAFAASDQHGIEQAIDNIRSLRQEHAILRHAAVDKTDQFAAQYGFTNGGEDLKAMAHEGHRY